MFMGGLDTVATQLSYSFHYLAANPADRTLFLDRSLKTTLQGTKLLGEKSLNLEKRIATFLQARAVNQNHIWAERRRPLSS